MADQEPDRRRSRLRIVALLGVVLGLVVLVGAARGQEAKPNEKLRFSAEHDLAGFEAAQFSDYADLYPFADFKEQDGKELSREEFDALLAKWKAERERVTKEIAALATDPALRSKRRLHRKLANHPFLSRLELVESDSFAPVLLVVQRPPKAKPGFEDAVVQKHGPWQKQAVDAFEHDWKEVLPPRREGCALLPVIFLASWGDFVNYCQTASGGAFNGAAHFNSDLQAVVCYAELMGGTRNENLERKASLNALIHLLIQSCAPNNNDPSTQWWLREGLASLYSNWSGDAKAPQVAVSDDQGVTWFGSLVVDEHPRDLFFMPVQQLLAIKNANDVYDGMAVRLGVGEASDNDWGRRVRAAFAVECELIVADLIRADGGKQRGAIATRLALLAAGGKGAPPPAVQPLDPALLQQRLAAALQGELKRLKAPAQIDDSLKGILATFKSSSGAADAAPKSDVASDVSKRATGLTGSGDDAPFDPAKLLAEPLPVDGRLGIALRLAAIGEIEAAATACEEIVKSLAGDDPKRERVERESRRLRELAAWRRDFVEQWKTGGKKLRIDHDGASTTGTVKSIDDSELVLLDAKARELRVPLSALGCDQLLRRATEAKLEVGAPRVRAYAELIAGFRSWQKNLAGATPEEVALKSDGAHWAELLAQGETAARIVRLAHLAVPTNPRQAEAPLSELRALFAAKGAASVQEPLRPLLRQLAALCFRCQFDSVGITAAGMKGRLLAKNDGTVRITYAFDRADELDDWEPASPQVWGSQQLAKVKTPADRQSAKIEKGALRILGTRLWLSKLQFRAPMSVSYKYRALSPPPDAPRVDVITLSITLCDDGRRSRILSTDMGGGRIIDAATRYDEENYLPEAWKYDTDNDNRVEHDGKTVTFTHAGEAARKIGCGGRQSGRVGIFICTDAWVEIEELEIEGHVDDQTLAPLRAAWVEKQVAALEKGELNAPTSVKGGKSEK